MTEEATFVNFNDEDAVELATLATGSEAQLRIVDAKLGHSDKEKGGDFLNLRLEIMGEPFTKDVNHILMFPKEGLSEKDNNNRKLAMKQFRAAFDIPSGGFGVAELNGKTAWAILAEKDDPEYGKQNRVKSWITGR